MKPLIRVTTIEAFRRYLANSKYDYYEITEQSVVDSIKGDFKGNELTRIGTAFHSVVEDCGKKHNATLVEGGFKFDIDGYDVYLSPRQVQTAIDYREEFPGAFHEFRLYKDYGRAVVTGCADLIHGIEMRDIKTKCSTITDREYTDSYQWRYYLDIFGADVFHFDLFKFDGYNREKHGYDVRGLELTRHMPPITCYRYPEMHDDCKALLHTFLDWAESRNLLQYLPTYPKQQ